MHCHEVNDITSVKICKLHAIYCALDDDKTFSILFCALRNRHALFFVKVCLSSMIALNGHCFHHLCSFSTTIFNDSAHRSAILRLFSREEFDDKMNSVKSLMASTKASWIKSYILQKRRPALSNLQVPLQREIGVEIEPGLWRKPRYLGNSLKTSSMIMITMFP